MAQTICNNTDQLRWNPVRGIQDLDQCLLSRLVESIDGCQNLQKSLQCWGRQAVFVGTRLNDFEMNLQAGDVVLRLNF